MQDITSHHKKSEALGLFELEELAAFDVEGKFNKLSVIVLGSMETAAVLGVILEGVMTSGVFGVILDRTEPDINSLELRLLEQGVPFLIGEGV